MVSAYAGQGPLWEPKIPQHGVVIAQAQALLALFEVRVAPRNPRFLRKEGPIFGSACAAVAISSEQLHSFNRKRHEPKVFTGPPRMLNGRALVAAGSATSTAA
jgi:hypothetical protein